MNSIDYKNKYLKYKNKYLKQKQIDIENSGGMFGIPKIVPQSLIDYVYNDKLSLLFYENNHQLKIFPLFYDMTSVDEDKDRVYLNYEDTFPQNYNEATGKPYNPKQPITFHEKNYYYESIYKKFYLCFKLQKNNDNDNYKLYFIFDEMLTKNSNKIYTLSANNYSGIFGRQSEDQKKRQREENKNITNQNYKQQDVNYFIKKYQENKDNILRQGYIDCSYDKHNIIFSNLFIYKNNTKTELPETSMNLDINSKNEDILNKIIYQIINNYLANPINNIYDSDNTFEYKKVIGIGEYNRPRYKICKNTIDDITRIKNKLEEKDKKSLKLYNTLDLYNKAIEMQKLYIKNNPGRNYTNDEAHDQPNYIIENFKNLIILD